MLKIFVRGAALASSLCMLIGSAHAAEPKTLPLKQAIDAAQAALASCKASGYNVTVTIMDPDYATRLVLRDDAAPARTVEIGRRKAYTVIKTGMTSGESGKKVGPTPVPDPRPPGWMPPGVNGDDNLITFAGGKPIKVGNETLGAISVSGAPGGEKDEVCVDAGLAKLKS